MFRYRLTAFTLWAFLLAAPVTAAGDETLNALKNYQVNGASIVSAGLPDKDAFIALQKQGVTTVIDLIPGDRENERALMQELGLAYHNIQVDWHNPTVEDFKSYTALMDEALKQPGKVLTHCKLNWRGSVFTYLYRVTSLHQSEAEARRDMEAIWSPNETWQAFIDEVLTSQ